MGDFVASSTKRNKKEVIKDVVLSALMLHHVGLSTFTNSGTRRRKKGNEVGLLEYHLSSARHLTVVVGKCH